MQPSLSLVIEVLPALEKETAPDHPTVNIHRKSKLDPHPPYLEHNPFSVENIRWIATIWPHNYDAHLAKGAKQISQRLDDHASNWHPKAAYLEPLFDPDTLFSEMAQLLLAVSLISRDADVRGLAIDALEQVIKDGRCTGPEFGHLVGRLMATGFVRRNRLAATLEAVAKSSPWHAHVCAQIVQTALIQAPFTADLHFLLSALQEWLSELGEPLGKEVTTVLGEMKAGGKSAKLIKTLMSRTEETDENRRKSALVIALQGRLERARRWLGAPETE
jgi:hypothetical protein